MTAKQTQRIEKTKVHIGKNWKIYLITIFCGVAVVMIGKGIDRAYGYFENKSKMDSINYANGVEFKMYAKDFSKTISALYKQDKGKDTRLKIIETNHNYTTDTDSNGNVTVFRNYSSGNGGNKRSAPNNNQ